MRDQVSIPAKEVYTNVAKEQRVEFLEGINNLSLSKIKHTQLDAQDLKGNIESFIGSIEVPVGAAGPLLVKGTNWEEQIVMPVATTEGALVSSISRGAKAISLAGGVNSRFISQTMSRIPMFVFETITDANNFAQWIQFNTHEISSWVSDYSNFAKLQKLTPEVFGKFVHLRFHYATGDAAGQNMVTMNTWNICRKILKKIELADIKLTEFYIDGNASNDKKSSFGSIANGRGTKVHCDVEISNEILKTVLKVDADILVKLYNRTRTGLIFGMANTDNVNIANTLAAIFCATGQDLACIGEASHGQFYMERTENGVYFSLLLSNLIIGTVGGGTQLAGQKQALEFIGCSGAGKAKRFAEIIAGFCLSLDISTSSAIAAGHFALAHDRLGRNRPEKNKL